MRAQGRAPFRRVERTRERLARPQDVGEAFRLVEQRRERASACAADKIVRVLTIRQKNETQRLARLQERQRPVDGAMGGGKTRLVAVEAEHRLVGLTPEQRKLGLGERGPERGDRSPEARAPERDDVHIAFADKKRRA